MSDDRPEAKRDPVWLRGFYRCDNCGNVENTEREVICWECGKGEMLWHDTPTRETATTAEEIIGAIVTEAMGKLWVSYTEMVNWAARRALAACEGEQELHAKINRAVSTALGQDSGASWHDLGEKVAMLKQDRDRLRDLLREARVEVACDAHMYDQDREMKCLGCRIDAALAAESDTANLDEVVANHCGRLKTTTGTAKEDRQ